MKCPNCGTENLEEMNFCQECGQPLAKLACLSCGHANRSGIRFCEECGFELASEEQIPCPACSHTNRPGVLFCEKCGHKLSQAKKRKKAIPRWQKITAAVIALALVAAVTIITVDRIKYSITKSEAQNIALGTIQVKHPELSDVVPIEMEYEDEQGNVVISYSYIKRSEETIQNGETVQLTYGALVTVNRNTGEVQVVTIR